VGSLTTDYAKLSEELDRLITQGHQDSSLLTALQKKFPDVTQSEIEAALTGITEARKFKAKRQE
jgi:hypothetical protein